MLWANVKPAHLPFGSKVIHTLKLKVSFGLELPLWHLTTTVEYKVTVDTVTLLRLGLGSVQTRRGLVTTQYSIHA